MQRHTNRAGKLGTALLALAMIAGPLVAIAPASTAGHLELDRVHHESADDASAFGVRAETLEDGPIRFTLSGEGPAESTPLSAGIVLFDEQGESGLVIAITLHRSPDRLVVSPTPANPEPASTPADPGDWETRTRGDVSLLDTNDVTFDVRASDASTESTGSDVVVTAGVTKLGAEAGTHNVGLWVGQVSSTTLEVSTNEPVGEVATSPGQARVAGDLDLERSTAEVQVQQEIVDPSLFVSGVDATLGFKAIADASVTVETEHGHYGFWALSEFRYACPGLNTVCVSADLSELPCPEEIPVACTTASLSWQGPSGEGSGETSFSFRDAQPGTYTFTLDHKVDIYGPRYVNEDTGTRAAWYEHHSYLTIGDFELPS